MPESAGESLWYDEDAEPEYVACWQCGGEGFVMACVDDMCRGLGECMRLAAGRAACRDGMKVCPACRGEGMA